MKLLRHYDKHTFHVVVCPAENWIQRNSLTEYIVDMESVVDFPKQEKIILHNFYKILICQNNNVKTFTKCGHIRQLYMPPVDVGYKCDKRILKDVGKNNSTYHRANIDSNYQITYEGKNLLKSTYATYLALSPEKNYKSNITEVNFYNYKSKFYSGQRLIYGIYKEYHKNEDNFGKSTRGYTYTYHAKYLLPEIYATLRLKINGVIQKFLNKIDENFGKIDVYTFDRREIKDAPMGCHAVPDKITYPAFNDFYERRYSTLLLIFDETAQQYKKVHNIQGLVSNKKYKCILIIKGSNSKTKKPNFIKETEFVINFIDEISPIWIIFVVLVIITVLLIVGFIILKRLQLKKKKSNDSLSTSSSKSKTKSLTVTSKVPKVPTTQKKNAFKTYMNIAKTMVTKNWNTNNKVTNFGQKVVGKNSNLINQIQNGTKNVVAKNSNLNLTNQTQNATKNVAGKNPNLNLTNQTQNATKNVIAKNPNINLVNQVKNTPKKIAVKNTNQKKISNVGDSVFKLK
uniref:Uncharacterized protein n=1 Tax=Strongyloides papillosus TaxID=174720 RepID=A0A0N5BQK1_STREA